MAGQRNGILQLGKLQLLGHRLELHQFAIGIQVRKATGKPVDLLHPVIGHICKRPHLRHGGILTFQMHLLPVVQSQPRQHGIQLCLRCGQVQ